jgi:hypothetical protein
LVTVKLFNYSLLIADDNFPNEKQEDFRDMFQSLSWRSPGSTEENRKTLNGGMCAGAVVIGEDAVCSFLC